MERGSRQLTQPGISLHHQKIPNESLSTISNYSADELQDETIHLEFVSKYTDGLGYLPDILKVIGMKQYTAISGKYLTLKNSHLLIMTHISEEASTEIFRSFLLHKRINTELGRQKAGPGKVTWYDKEMIIEQKHAMVSVVERLMCFDAAEGNGNGNSSVSLLDSFYSLKRHMTNNSQSLLTQFFSANHQVYD